MKTEDIDKRIGMPDVDTEWARFEREVIDKSAVSHKKVWLWGLSIAASIILMAGLFFFNQDIKEPEQLLAEQEAPLATEGTEAPIITANRVEEQVAELRKELAILPASSNLSTVGRLRGIGNNDIDSFLVVVNGKTLFDSRGMTLEETERRIEEYLNEQGLLENIKIPWQNGAIEIWAVTPKEREEIEHMIATADIVPNSGYLDSKTPYEKTKQPLIDEPMQGQIAGLEAIDPNYSDSILVLLDGKRLPDSLCTLHFARRGIHPYLEKKGLRVGKMVRLSGEILSNEVFGKDESERAKQRYAGYIERYGELARHGVAEITSANDSANEVFILQHPELQRTHRRVEGYVVEQETNEPCGYTYIYYRRYNTSADSLGHFVLWVPKSADSLCAKWVGSKSVYFPPADSILTIRLKDNIFGELKNLFPPKR